jgi:hypothetical protein
MFWSFFFDHLQGTQISGETVTAQSAAENPLKMVEKKDRNM